MAVVIDECYEGEGYEESWNGESVSAGCTYDEDYDTSNVGSPSGWADDCLRVALTAGSDNSYNSINFADQAVSYLRVSIVVVSSSLTSGQEAWFCACEDNGGSETAYHLYLHNDGSNLKFIIKSRHDGSSNTYTGFPNVATSTKYIIEVKWDANANAWAWRIDGVDQPNDQDDSDPVESEGVLSDTHATVIDRTYIGTYNTDNAAEYCVDMVTIQDDTWVYTGAEETLTNNDSLCNHKSTNVTLSGLMRLRLPGWND